MRDIQQFVANMVPAVKSRRPSARELNLLKRKAKISFKDQSKAWSNDGNAELSQPQDLDMTSPKGTYPDILCSNKVERIFWSLFVSSLCLGDWF